MSNNPTALKFTAWRLIPQDIERLKDVGEIVVQVYRKTEHIHHLGVRESNTASIKYGDMGEVHEHALQGQARSHYVS